MSSLLRARNLSSTWWRTALLVTLCVALRAVAEVAVWQSGFRGLAGDDFMKINGAQAWSQRPALFPSSIWLPMDYWTVGAASCLFPTAYSGAIAVNSFFGALSLVMFSLWARELLGELVAALAGALMAVFPLQVWMSLTPPGEAAFLAFLMLAVFFLFRWERGGQTLELWLAALALLAGNATRYHSWIFSVLVAGWVVGRLVRRRASARRALNSGLAVGLPFTFPALYLLWGWSRYGTPLHFLREKAERDMQIAPYAPPLARLAEVPALFVLAGPILAAVCVAGLILYLRARDAQRWLLLWLAGGYFFILSFLTVATKTEALSVPHRYLVPLMLLMAPLAGALIVRLWRWKLVAALVVLAVLVWQATACLRYPCEYVQEWAIAKYVNQLWKVGVLRSEDRVVSIERGGRFGRVPAILSSRPERFLYVEAGSADTPAWEKFAAPNDPRTIAWLDREKIAAVLVARKSQAPCLEEYLEQYAAVGGCKIFVRRDRPWPEAPPPEPVRFRRTVIASFADAAPLCAGTQLLRCVYERGKFSREVVLDWRLDPEESFNVLTARLDPVMGRRPACSFPVEINGGFRRPARAPHQTSDAVNLVLSEPVPPGLCVLRLECAEERGQTVELGQFYVMRSKRDVLQKILRGDFSDWRIALDVVLSLSY